MSKRPTARQAANEPYWFAKDQEVSKAVTPMTDPEYKVEFDGKETYVICNGVKLAIRRDNRRLPCARPIERWEEGEMPKEKTLEEKLEEASSAVERAA